MPTFNYQSKGWPATINFAQGAFTIQSSRGNIDDIVCVLAGQEYPHITIHGINKEGPDDWKRTMNGEFHVVLDRGRIFEYNRQGAHNFGGGGANTGGGTVAQTNAANLMATTFRNAIDAILAPPP